MAPLHSLSLNNLTKQKRTWPEWRGWLGLETIPAGPQVARADGRTDGRRPFEVGDELDADVLVAHAVGCLAWREESQVWEPKVRERRSSFLPLAAVRLC